MLGGLACASLLLIVGCGGDPEIAPPSSSPAKKSPDNSESPGNPSQDTTDQDPTSPKETIYDPFAKDPVDSKNGSKKNLNKKTPDHLEGGGKNPFAGSSGKGLLSKAAFLKGIDRERPSDISEWIPSDLKPAIIQKDPMLPLAIRHFEKQYEGNPQMVEILMMFLNPTTFNPDADISDNPNNPNNSNNRHGNRNRKNNKQFQLDQKIVERLVVALARNKTPQAAQALRKIVEDKKLLIVHPQAATKAALQILAVMDIDHIKNDKVLFTALVDPREYRDLKGDKASSGRGSHNRNQSNGQRMSAEQLAKEAADLLQPLASENLRTRLGAYVLPDSPISGEDREKFLAWFEESIPENLMGQMRIYEENVPNVELLDQFEEHFALYSGTALVRLLGILSNIPDLSVFRDSKHKRPSLQELRGWGGGGSAKKGDELQIYIAECLDEKTRKNSPEEELARLTQRLWGNSIATIMIMRLNERLAQNPLGDYSEKDAKKPDEKNRIAMACTMPLDKVRNALFKRCKSYYQQGPDIALAGLLSQKTSEKSMDPMMKSKGSGDGRSKNDPKLLAIDPGLLVTLKMLHREDPNIVSNTAANTTRGRPTPRSNGANNVQNEWFYASQQLVAKMLTQCHAACSMPPVFGDMASLAPAPKTEEEKTGADPSSVELHKDAQIVKRLDFKLPGSAQGPLGKLPIDPLEVHYIRIEEITHVNSVLKHYQRTVQGQQHPLTGGKMGFWFDSIQPGKAKGTMRSVDVLITPGMPKAVNPGGKRTKPRKGVASIVVQILVIEAANPTITK